MSLPLLGFSFLADMGVIAITGIEAASFLQGQLTCDVTLIEEANLAAYCNRQGRVLATAYLCKQSVNYYLWLPRENIPATLSELKKYAVFSSVELIDKSDAFCSIGLLGDSAIAAWNNQSVLNPLSIFGITITHPFSRAVRVVSQEALSTIIAEMHGAHITEIDASQWMLADIQAGIPNISTQTRGLFTPHDLNYPALGGVSFKKGCYVGQEIIARMQYLGKLKQGLEVKHITSEKHLEPSMPLYEDEKIIGHIVNVQQTKKSEYDVLAVLLKKL